MLIGLGRAPDADEDQGAAEALDQRQRLAEDQPAEKRRGDSLEENHQRGEHRRQPAERHRQQTLSARLADERHGGQRRDPLPGLGDDPGVEQDGDDQKDRRRDDPRLEGHPGRARVPGPPDRQEIEAEEERRADAEEIAPDARRIDLEALADQRRAAEKAEHRPTMVPRETRCFSTIQTIRITKSGAVVAKKVALATVVLRIERCQKKRSPAKARPARHRRAGKGAPGRRRARASPRSPSTHRPPEGRARRARRRWRRVPQVGGGKAHEDRRDAHRDGAEAQGGKAGPGSIPLGPWLAWRTCRS